MARLVLIRHAPAIETGICYGRFDPPTEEVLSKLPQLEKRVRQLEEEAAFFLETVISSPAGRCRKVAEPLSVSLERSIQVDDRLAEIHMGEWEGIPFSELEGDPDFEYWMQNYQRVAPPEGESIVELETRLRSWLRQRPIEGGAVVVTHAGVIRALSVILCGSTWDAAMGDTVKHLFPYLIDFSPNEVGSVEAQIQTMRSRYVSP